MPRLTIGLGAVLIVIGAISYIATSFASWTALIPAILGALILISGLIALKNQMVGVHIGLLLAVIGAAGTLMNVMQLPDLFAGTAERPAAVIASSITFVLLVIYVVMGVRSFISARRWKREQASISA